MIRREDRIVKTNHKIYNKFKFEINKKYEDRVSDDLPSIKELVLNKLNELNTFCEQRDVCYFSELPISEEINSDILFWLDEGLEYKNKIIDCNKIKNIKFVIPGITELKYELIATRNLKEYLKCYQKIESIDIKSEYSEYYESYYKKYITGYDASEKKTKELNKLLDRDIEITDKLGLSEEFVPVKRMICSVINIGLKKHVKTRLININ